MMVELVTGKWVTMSSEGNRDGIGVLVRAWWVRVRDRRVRVYVGEVRGDRGGRAGGRALNGQRGNRQDASPVKGILVS